MQEIIRLTSEVGEVANRVASDHTFSDYLQRKSENTRKAQGVDLSLFSNYLSNVSLHLTPIDLQTNPKAWSSITWGLVAGFIKWGLVAGYATTTLNRSLSTIKVYSELAFQSGSIPMDEHLRIKNLTSFSHKESRRVDGGREVIRRSNKKSTPVRITDEQATKLKNQPDTPQGRRDQVIMCLLLDHGLRCGELANLKIGDFDLKSGTFRFYRSKTDTEQSHKLSSDALRSLFAWLKTDCNESTLLRGSRKGGNLTDDPMDEISITRRVGTLGEAIGLSGLSAHDCRHYWATHWAGKVDVFRLQEAGGWKSLAMPRRYVEAAKIANEGMI